MNYLTKNVGRIFLVDSMAGAFLNGLYICCAMLVLWTGIHRPAYNWDMIPYTASALALETRDIEKIHGYIYSALKNHVGAKSYLDLTDSHKFHRTMALDARYFSKQLPFYKPRLIYNAMVLALHKLDINIFLATHLISAAFASASMLLLLILAKENLDFISALILPAFAGAFGIFDLAALSTPDAIALFVVLLTVVFTLKGNVWVLVLLPISVLIRTDLIIWCGILILYLFWVKQFSARSLLISAGLTVCTYVLINLWAGNYGWQTLFYFTFIDGEHAYDPSLLTSHFTPTQYLWQVYAGLKKALFDKEFLFFTAIAILVLNRFWKVSGFMRFRNAIDIRLMLFGPLPVLYIATHFLLYPVTWNRFFIAFYLIVVIGFLWMLSDKEKRNEALDQSSDH